MTTNDKTTTATVLDDLARDRPAFVAFARKRAPALDAEDLVQQAFARAQEKLHTLRDPAAGKAWFYRILRRRIADHLAHNATKAGKLEQLAADLEDVPEEDLAVCACALGLMDTLKDNYRRILEQVDLYDESLSAAADFLNISRNNAAVRLHRARGDLRNKLLQHCGVKAGAACSACNCSSPQEAKI